MQNYSFAGLTMTSTLKRQGLHAALKFASIDHKKQATQPELGLPSPKTKDCMHSFAYAVTLVQ